MDNATAEYTFVKGFFSIESKNPLPPSTALLSPDGGNFVDNKSFAGSDHGGGDRPATTPTDVMVAPRKEELAAADTIWKQILDPVLVYCEVSSFLSFSERWIHYC